MGRTLYLIDGHATLYRAYFAIKSRLSQPGTGTPTNAAFGFTRVLRSLLAGGPPKGRAGGPPGEALDRPDYLAVAMDSPGPTFRHEMYDRYKSSRPAMPEDMVPQIGMVERICEAYGLPVFRAPGYEADDVLATLAFLASAPPPEGAGVDVTIISGDKDLLQIVTGGAADERGGKPRKRAPGRIAWYDPQKEKRLDADGVLRDRGVSPAQMVDLLGLAGDSSDDIPGVPGIGPKTAVSLLKKYGSLEEVLEAAREGKEKGKRGKNLVEFADQARLSRKLATVSREAPVELDLEMCRTGEAELPANADKESLIEVFQELGFRAFLKDLVPRVSGRTPSGADAPLEEPDARGGKESLVPLPGGVKYQIVDTPGAFENLLSALSKQKRFAFDLETDSAFPRRANIVGLSFSWKAKEAHYVPVRSPEGERRLDEKEVIEGLRPLLEDAGREKIGQNAKYDILVLKRAGVTLRGLAFDTMLASYVLDPSSRSHGIDALALQHLVLEKISTKEIIGSGKDQTTMDRVPVRTVGPYACEDADVTWRLAEILEGRLGEPELGKLRELYRELELPLVDVLVELEWNGIKLDTRALRALSDGMAEAMEIEEKSVYEAAGREFLIGSTKQLRELLYGELGLPVMKKTPKGDPSTDSDVLSRLAGKHPLPKRVLRYRELAKLKSTYADALPGAVCEETGRIHASFHQTVTATGRLSSSDPNLQNIPVRSDEGRAIRRCFVPDGPGRKKWKFLSADYSQIELRLLAHLSGDSRLVEAFRAGRDIHAAVAAELADVPIAEVTDEMRRRAKTVNFGLMYGQGAQHLARSTGMTVKEADEFISRYFRRFEGVKELKADVVERARARQRVETMLGRVRFLPEINSDDVATRRSAERIAFNTIIQGSAADLIKRAMIDCHREMKRRGMKARMLLQIHDELLFEAPPEDIEPLRELVVEKMSGALDIDVPLVVDTGVGPNWLDLEYA